MSCSLPMIVNGGPRKWSMVRDRKGYRTYSITHRVQINRGIGGPFHALEDTPGLPQPGSPWIAFDEYDDWAYFTQDAKVEQVGIEAGNEFYDITQIATSEPQAECPEDGRQDPLTVPDRVHIESVDYQKEAVFDANGDAIVNSAWEQYRGPQVEFDNNRLRIVIEQNVADLELPLLESLLHTTNDAILWDFPIGTVKFSRFDMDPKYHVNCSKYWTRRLIFDVDENGWSRKLLDEGTKVLHGRWDQKQGSGGTVILVVVGGVITSATIDNGGSGYPESAIVPLHITGGTGGILLVETNASGTITAFIRVHRGGTGYTAGVTATTQRGYWVLIRFNKTGEVPHPNNPQHFDRPGDIKGQNTRFILDGKGMPIGLTEEPGEIIIDYYDSSNLLQLAIPVILDQG